MSPRFLRRIHLLLGCFFAPILFYYIVSGAWQSFGYGDRPKRPEPGLRTTLAAASNPHKHLAFPGASGRDSHSKSFAWFVGIMAVGVSVTLLTGVYLALTSMRPRWAVFAALALGILVPVWLLWSAVKHAGP